MKEAITEGMDMDVFTKTYYRKEELIAFCKEKGLQTIGNKQDLTKIVMHYLNTKEKLIIKKERRNKDDDTEITLDSIITLPITYSEKKRAFFSSYLGENFHFYVPFQRWLKANAGKTYRDAIHAYPQILEEKKKGNIAIDRQFEYNTYIRAFFKDNPGKCLQDAIACWKYRREQQGSHGYCREDLCALEKS